MAVDNFIEIYDTVTIFDLCRRPLRWSLCRFDNISVESRFIRYQKVGGIGWDWTVSIVTFVTNIKVSESFYNFSAVYYQLFYYSSWLTIGTMAAAIDWILVWNFHMLAWKDMTFDNFTQFLTLLVILIFYSCVLFKRVARNGGHAVMNQL